MYSGCTKVGPETVKTAAKHCQLLEVVNLNYTAVPPVSIAPLLLNCKQLATLKVAGIPNWVRLSLPLFACPLPFILRADGHHVFQAMDYLAYR